jgi:hypothetical protein
MEEAMIIELSESEIAVAELIGTMRYEASKKNGAKDQQVGGQDPVQINIDGVMAELAAARALNLCPDLIVNARGGAPYDLITHEKRDADGRLYQRAVKIDVKATRWPNGQLVVHPHKNPGDCDYYLLAIVTGDTVNLIKFASAETVFQPENFRALTHHPDSKKTYALYQHEMKDFRP